MIPKVATVTPASLTRLDHLLRQRDFLHQIQAEGTSLLRSEAWLDHEPPPASLGPILHVPPGTHGMRVGAARNLAAHQAVANGADLIIFLDVDCLPGPQLVQRYVRAAQALPNALLAGPVTYLEATQRPSDITELAALTNPHPARPFPAADRVVRATRDQIDLFWSLSFAVTAETWGRLGGFDEKYEGYGAEDTDLARKAAAMDIELHWVGGAHVYHQWHPTNEPPWQHLDDILRNGRHFAEAWGDWPMTGWLDAFESAGAIEPHDGGYRKARPPSGG